MFDVSCSPLCKRLMLNLESGTNCQNWSDSGSMSFQSASATWMHAKAAGDPLNSDDPNQGIPFHGPSYGLFEWDFADAKGGDNPNPFTSADANSKPGTPIDNKDIGSTKRRILTAHGVLACMAFIIFFPTGAISLRILPFRSVVWVHVGIQGFAFLMFIIAFGMGIYLTKDDYVSSELVLLRRFADRLFRQAKRTLRSAKSSLSCSSSNLFLATSTTDFSRKMAGGDIGRTDICGLGALR